MKSIPEQRKKAIANTNMLYDSYDSLIWILILHLNLNLIIEL